jgi:hypothetical protein
MGRPCILAFCILAFTGSDQPVVVRGCYETAVASFSFSD